MIRTITAIALILAGFAATGCATTPRPTLVDPEETVDVMHDAYLEDDPGLFLHTLGRPVLREYSEHLLRVGWSDIRPRVGEFVEGAEVVEVEDFEPVASDPLVDPAFVWPDDGAPLARVRLRVDGRQEDFLFQQEVDPPAELSKQARGFWIGDSYYVRTEHPSPATYLVEDSPEDERTHWRIVFPFHPFQHNGELTRALQQRLADEG